MPNKILCFRYDVYIDKYDRPRSREGKAGIHTGVE